MRQTGLAACALALCLVAASPATAQQPPAAQKERATGNLAVEMDRDEGRPTYVLANRSVWFTPTRRIEGWQRPAHVPPVRAVQVAARPAEGDALHVTVSVKLGERFLDEDRAVATFVAREGDAIVPEGLREFGVVPFALRIVRARAEANAPPYVETGVASLELLAVEPAARPPHSFNLRLRNNSAKTVAAVELIYVPWQGKFGEHWRRQPQEEPLAAPGAVFELNVAATGRGELLADGYAPGGLREVRINSVVFSDGTFEGDENGAVWVNALRRGRKLQLGRVLPLVERALAASPESDAAAEEFKTRVAALGETVALAELDALLPRFARLGPETKERVRHAYEFSLHRVKLELLDSLRKFEEARRDQPEPPARKSWFEGVKGDYEKQLARM
jgi:hypothetical protein